MTKRPGRFESAAQAAELGPEYRKAAREANAIRLPDAAENAVTRLDRAQARATARGIRATGNAIEDLVSPDAPPEEKLREIARGADERKSGS